MKTRNRPATTNTGVDKARVAMEKHAKFGKFKIPYAPVDDWMQTKTDKPGKLTDFDVAKIFPNLIAFNPDSIFLGINVGFNIFCFLHAHTSAPIRIGNNCLFGPFVTIITTEHNYESADIPIYKQKSKQLPITIGNDVWIGANVTILPGVNIPDGCVIGAGSVVCRGKKLKKYGVYMGYPLQLINTRKSKLQNE